MKYRTDNFAWQSHNRRRLDPEDILLIRELREHGLTMREIAEKFEVTQSYVSKIVSGKAWSHLQRIA